MKRSRRGLRARAALAVTAIALYPLLVGFGDSPETRNRRGNRYYRQEKFDEALTEYRSAQVLAPELAELFFNAGDALYRKGVLPDAIREFAKASGSADSLLAAGAYYNAGTASLSMGDLETAIDSFKASLRIDPTDPDAKHNLELALRLRDQQEQQQQQDRQQDQQNQEQQDQQDQDQESQQDQQQQDQDQQDRQQESGEEQSEAEQDERPQQEQAMSPEDAARLLDAIEEAERELQAELRAAKARKRAKVDKDW